jgi:hypothetical protein
MAASLAEAWASSEALASVTRLVGLGEGIPHRQPRLLRDRALDPGMLGMLTRMRIPRRCLRQRSGAFLGQPSGAWSARCSESAASSTPGVLRHSSAAKRRSLTGKPSSAVTSAQTTRYR